MITSSTDDEQQLNQDEQNITTINRQVFLKRSEPISMSGTFIVRTVLAAGNATSSTKTEQPISTTLNNLLMDTCFKSSSNESVTAVKLYTPFGASPPNQINIPLSPQTPLPISSMVTSTSNTSTGITTTSNIDCLFHC